MIFTQLGDREARRTSYLRPLQYARWLHERHLVGGDQVGDETREGRKLPVGYRA
jgi:hypothetical protein